MRRYVGFLVEVIETLLLTVVVYLLVQAFVAQPFRIEQGSMEATLHPGQYVLIDKLTPQFDDYSRGDIIVFHPATDAADPSDSPFIKRVIGEPGDDVAIHDGHVWIDGVALEEADYVFHGEQTFAEGEAHWTVPEATLFVLGDHRSNSTDSRLPRIGMVPIESVIGRAVLRYWPMSSIAVLDTPTYPQLTTGSAP